MKLVRKELWKWLKVKFPDNNRSERYKIFKTMLKAHADLSV